MNDKFSFESLNISQHTVSCAKTVYVFRGECQVFELMSTCNDCGLRAEGLSYFMFELISVTLVSSVMRSSGCS